LCYTLCDFNAAKHNGTKNDSSTGGKRVVHPARFTPAKDTRKRKIRGLWVRNGRFYAQMRVDMGNGTTKAVSVPLKATALDAAKTEMESKRTEKQTGELHLPGHRPKFSKLVEHLNERQLRQQQRR